MFSVPHLVVLFIVVLVFFGPHKLPELARGLGKLMAEFRKASNDFKMAFEEEMRNIERQTRENEWKKSQEEAEAKRQAELAASGDSTSSPSDNKSLPEHATASQSAETQQVEVLDPVISPVSEAVARDSHFSEASPDSSTDPVIDVPAEEATSSDASSTHASSSEHAADVTSSHASGVTDEPADLSSQPHDHRQPA
jgi:sec-independent protein translocase protein TatB